MLWMWCFYGGGVALALLILLIDAYIGLRCLDDLSQPQWRAEQGSNQPRITVVVPALNEEKGIEACLRSLAAQDHKNLEIIAVNDRSTDATGSIMERIAAEYRDRVRVLHVTALPPAWLGKTHAMWKAATSASGDWLLFTDGDVVFRKDAIGRAMAYAEKMLVDHVSVLPTLITKSVGERMMIAMFQFGIATARPWKAQDPKSRFAVGAGAFNMVRRNAYETVGGFEALRLEVVEDMGLAFRLKRAGFASRAPLAPELVSVHWASGAMGIVRTLTKNGYAVIGFRWYLALAIALLVLAFHVGPFLFVWIAPGPAKFAFALALACLFAFYLLFAGKNGISPWYFLLHPVAGVLTAYAVLRSAALTIAGRGVVWRGTKYSLAELRRASEQRAGGMLPP
jgi:glycosyltransferase involved in cell wall biosynthesis